MDSLLDWQTVGLSSLGMFIFAHTLMFVLRKSPRLHRGVIYVATLLGGSSLMLGLYQSEDQLAKWARPAAEQQHTTNLQMLTEQIAWDQDYYCNTEFHRSSISPSNFDQLVAADTDVCRTLQGLTLKSKAWTGNDADIQVPELYRPEFDWPMSRQSAQALLKLVSYYNLSAKELRRLKEAGQPSPLLVTLTVLGPYVLIAAFCIGLASILFPCEAAPANTHARKVRRKRRDISKKVAS